MPNYADMSDSRLMEALKHPKYIGEVIEIKKEGIARGNYVIVLKAAGMLEQSDTTSDLKETLRHAVGKYGWSFDDSSITVKGASGEDISIGGLFQMIYGREFVNRFPNYNWLSREEKNFLNRKMWEESHNGQGTLN